MITAFLFVFIFRSIVSSQRIPCNKDTDIKQLGHGLLLCQYSALSDFAVDLDKNQSIKYHWPDLSGNNNDMTEKHIHGIWQKQVPHEHIWETSIINGAGNRDNNADYGYIKFPKECNLLQNGYTLFTMSMYYDPADEGARLFGNCMDKPHSSTFISGWNPSYYGSHEIAAIHNGQQIAYIGNTNDNYKRYPIISDTINSFHVFGKDFTFKSAPKFGKLTNDVWVCVNFHNGKTLGAPVSIKEYIVYGEELAPDDRRCVEEYLYHKHELYQDINNRERAPYNTTENVHNTTTRTPTKSQQSKDDSSWHKFTHFMRIEFDSRSLERIGVFLLLLCIFIVCGCLIYHCICKKKLKCLKSRKSYEEISDDENDEIVTPSTPPPPVIPVRNALVVIITIGEYDKENDKKKNKLDPDDDEMMNDESVENSSDEDEESDDDDDEEYEDEEESVYATNNDNNDDQNGGRIEDMPSLSKDHRNLKEVFTILKYQIMPIFCKLNWKRAEIIQYLLDAGKQLFSDEECTKLQRDALVVVISAHGMKDHIVTSDYLAIGKTAIHRLFSERYPHCREIPRIFIFDSCENITMEQRTDTPLDLERSSSYFDIHDVDSLLKSLQDEEEKSNKNDNNTAIKPFISDKNPDYKLVEIHGANTGFESKLNDSIGSYLIYRFTTRLKGITLDNVRKTISEIFTEIQTQLHDAGKQQIVKTFNNGTESVMFLKRKDADYRKELGIRPSSGNYDNDDNDDNNGGDNHHNINNNENKPLLLNPQKRSKQHGKQRQFKSYQSM